MSDQYWHALSRVWPFMFAHDLGRYVLTAGFFFLVFSVVLRRALAKRRLHPHAPQRDQIRREVLYSMTTAAIFSAAGLFLYFGTLAGVTKIYGDASLHGRAYWLASVILTVILHDAYFYWTHRLLHHPRLFRHTHLVHHLSHNPSPWAAYAFHPWEALVNALFVPMLAVAIPLHAGAIGAFLTVMIVKNVWAHLGIELFPRGFASHPLTSWISSTTHHDLHHRYTTGNYGLYFTWWDSWFGTMQPRYLETFDDVTGGRSSTYSHSVD